ncbi:hypothetical protein ASPFODRAFT_518954 [Aspergillus luchuensis CBS 106.47]|uniref:S-adenosylmethionine:tRNA ribosyltransferase-isomerase n=1 Tax=Aspergillus luchuensis (strain CBS 106.47) TaxID=1137211 RepID=A0A1M3SZH3_ASPLC|nr:hypothetical protein ASPFODRAFT_518954 [Aspergillus luchuensis CBS 106.47]
MKIEELDYTLDRSAMPHDPVELRGQRRDSGKLIVLDRSAANVEHSVFSNVIDYFRPGDLLVLNDSYLLPNSLWFQYGEESTQLTVSGLEPDGSTIIAVKTDKPWVQPGITLVSTNDSQLSCTLLETEPGNLWKAKFEPLDLLTPALEQHGQRLNDGIHIKQEHLQNQPQAYRSVFAKVPGSLQIPSAGLHFSRDLIAQAIAKGVGVAHITLHVGATEIFLSRVINEGDVANHKVRSEYFKLGEKAAAQINQARSEGRRVIAIGTTVIRTLESVARNDNPGGAIMPQEGWTDLYIYPGFGFKVVDVLLTNLHAPRSTHLVLAAAFAGLGLVR